MYIHVALSWLDGNRFLRPPAVLTSLFASSCTPLCCVSVELAGLVLPLVT
jgi:hypothetical protein